MGYRFEFRWRKMGVDVWKTALAELMRHRSGRRARLLELADSVK